MVLSYTAMVQYYWWHMVTSIAPQGESSYPWLPAGKQLTEIGWVAGLLDQVVHLPTHAQRDAVLNPLQLLPQSQQDALRHLVGLDRVVPIAILPLSLKDTVPSSRSRRGTGFLRLMWSPLDVKRPQGTDGPKVQGVVEENLQVLDGCYGPFSSGVKSEH